MRFKEIEYGGYTIRLCDVPSIRHWKVRKDGATITTALTRKRAKEKVRALNEKERTLK